MEGFLSAAMLFHYLFFKNPCLFEVIWFSCLQVGAVISSLAILILFLSLFSEGTVKLLQLL